MLISHQHEFIFVHIYKTGGMSIREALRPCTSWQYRAPWRPILRKLGEITGLSRWNPPHDHASACEVRDYVSDEVFEKYFTFAFVRNPWAWNVSLYFYERSSPSHRNHGFTSSLDGLTEFIEFRTDARRDLVRRYFDYVTSRPSHADYAKLTRFSNFEAFWAHRQNSRRPHQNDFVSDEEGEVIVDFIGRVEQLQQDFQQVCRRIGLPSLELPHRNQTDHRPYQDYYTPRTRRLIAEHFQKDIGRFDYEFSPGS